MITSLNYLFIITGALVWGVAALGLWGIVALVVWQKVSAKWWRK